MDIFLNPDLTPGTLEAPPTPTTQAAETISPPPASSAEPGLKCDFPGCKHADRVFKNEAALAHHKRDGHGIVPAAPQEYTCPHCGRPCASQNSLTAHVAACPERTTPPAADATPQKPRTVRTGSGAKNVCPYCDATAWGLPAINKHIQAEHPGQPVLTPMPPRERLRAASAAPRTPKGSYACPHCGEPFAGKFQLGGHTRWCPKRPDRQAPPAPPSTVLEISHHTHYATGSSETSQLRIIGNEEQVFTQARKAMSLGLFKKIEIGVL